MFFKNATLFRIAPALLQGIVTAPAATDGAAPAASPLLAGLADCTLKPIGPMELSTYGFVPPFGGEHDALAQQVGNHVLVTLAGEHKIIPPSSVNALLAKRCAEIEQKEGRRPGGRTRKRLKDEIVTDLLPKALVKPSRVDAILDIEQGFIAVDTTSRKVAEQVVSELRRALGSLPALPLNAEAAPRAVLTAWVAGEELPEGVTMGDEVEMRDPADNGAVVKCKGQELASDEVAKHLEAGKQVTRLALVIDDRMSFTFDEGLTVRKIRLLDTALESYDPADLDSLHEELQARLTLMGGELRRLFEVLEPAFDLSAAEEAA